jgi:hypothetical protein
MPLFDFDAQQIKEIAESGASRKVKRHWIKEGYSHQMSLYGVNTNRETEESSYKRIEILSNTPLTERIVSLLYEWFSYMVPGSPYTLWVYDVSRDSIKIVGEYK